MNLTDINEIRAVLERSGFRFSKSMGQNFLCAAWVPEDIADAAGLDRDTGVLEIGPGIGCLTRQLSERAGKVLSVELDKSLMPVLEQTLRGCENVQVLFGDIMKKDLAELAAAELGGFSRLCVCANLPYNITTPVLTRLIESGLFQSITVMVQLEVAQRICARENTDSYGAFTVFAQWHCSAKLLFEVPAGCFIPQPKVTSAVIRLDRRDVPLCAVEDERLMFAVVRAAFNQRRKTLVNALANNLGAGMDKLHIKEAIADCGFDENVRGERLSVQDFARLSDRLGKRKK